MPTKRRAAATSPAARPAPAPAAPVTADEPAPFDFLAAVEAGYVFTRVGVVWGVTDPAGRSGHGPTPEDAARNIDAQILPDPVTGRRVLHRADGSQVWLDPIPAEG